ncbi:hypothetical protein [Neisseria yangbaofengii]|uniref:hypothetical protein n=1 Tax=Neisseria yangbaofengii TaxID=2709396 RepID=UPI0013EBDADB|nr:hypothetical protein [Neisseria yangbaofengii]
MFILNTNVMLYDPSQCREERAASVIALNVMGHAYVKIELFLQTEMAQAGLPEF